jgi:hypothetical protein
MFLAFVGHAFMNECILWIGVLSFRPLFLGEELMIPFWRIEEAEEGDEEVAAIQSLFWCALQ